MALTDHVQLTVTLDSVGISRAGFGVPMILSHNAAWPDRIRFYTSLADVATDGFDDTSPEYLAAAAFLSQSPRPPMIAIGRATASVTQRYEIDVSAVRNSTAYTITVGGEDFEDADATYTSDSAATTAEIHNGLLTAINAVTGNTYIAAFASLVNPDDTFTAAASDVCTAVAHGLLTGDGPFRLSTSAADLPLNLLTATDYWIIRLDADTFSLATTLVLALAGTAVDIGDAGTGTHTLEDVAGTKRPDSPFTVTADAAGGWFSMEVDDVTALLIKQTHTVSGLGDDLDAILLADASWYELHTLYNSQDYVTDAALWVEANKRIYVVDVNENEAITVVVGSGTDTLKALFTLGYARTMYGYHPRPSAMFSAAWMGRWLPTDPGAATTKFKTLSGVEAVSLTGTHRNNLIARRANSYQAVAGRNITWEGTVGSTVYKFLDVVRNLDWVEDDVTKGVFGALAGNDVVPYTPEGLLIVENEIRATCARAVAKGIFSATPEPVVTSPVFDDISSTDKEERVLRDMKFSGTLAGAVHKVLVTGSVTF